MGGVIVFLSGKLGGSNPSQPVPNPLEDTRIEITLTFVTSYNLLKN